MQNLRRLLTHPRAVLLSFFALAGLFLLTRPATAQWTSTDARNAFNAYNDAFYYNPGGDHYVAVGALVLSGANSNANTAAVSLMQNLSGGSASGFNILPNYGQGGTDGGGFNGIALRWIGYALTHNAITNTQVLPWAQTNVSQAWSVRNSSGISWNNWFARTPDGGLYSWDASNTVAGMLDIPAPE